MGQQDYQDIYGEIPGELALVAEEVSVDVAFIIADRFGGRQMDVPKKLTDSHALVKVLGRKDADAVLEYFGGGRIRWPLAKQFRIKYMWKRGDRTADIVEKVGVSDATIYSHVKGMPRDRIPPRRPSQLKLDADERTRLLRRRLKEGAPLKEIAAELKITRPAVRDLMKRSLPEDAA